MSADFRIVAGQAIPALTVSLPFNCDIHLEKIFISSAPSLSIKVFTSQNGFLFCDQTAMTQLNVHWANLIEIARNCSEQNVTLNRLNGSNQLQLCTTRSIAIDECLKLWPSAGLLTEWNIPDYLQLANFIGINQYKCINCLKVYEEPNQLKIHSALSCGRQLADRNKNEDISTNSGQPTILTKFTCNNLLDHYRTSSSSAHQPLKNSTPTHIAFNPFTFSTLQPIKSDSILKANLNNNLNPLNNHLLVSQSSYSDNRSSLNSANVDLIGHNISNFITHHHLIGSLSNSGITNTALNNGLIGANLMNNNSINNNYLKNHPNHLMTKRRKIDQSNDLINALNKLNESQRDRPLDMSCMNKLSNKNHLNQFSGLNQLQKLNEHSKSNDINLIDSDQSSDTTDEILNDKVVTSSSMSLLNINPPTKNRTMKLTKEPRTHTCRFCGKLYTRKYGLKIHIRTHTGHKPLKCIHCSRRFSDPSNLNKHQRLHDQHKQWNKQIDVKS